MTTHANTPECDAFDATLADYLENTLDHDARANADAHRATCARCDALVRDLDLLRVDASQLAPLTPSHDLWPGIAARIGTPVTTLDDARIRRRDHSRAWISARAAAALVLMTAGATYVVARWTSHQPTQQVAVAPVTRAPAPTTAPARTESTAKPTVPAAGATPTLPTPTTVTPVARKQSAEATYAQEITSLHAIVQARSAQLDPHTRAVIEHNLKVIDTAIAESRRALANDPHSAFLSGQLDEALSTKLELMRTVALLPART
jgi:hypothetical protein